MFRPAMPTTPTGTSTAFATHRGGGRASARETAVRVAAGAIARKWLRERYGVTVRGWMSRLGRDRDSLAGRGGDRRQSVLRAGCRDRAAARNYMDALRKSGDSVGAEVTVVARGVPVGWGDPVYDRLDADIAYAMMGINAVKGVEIGAGFPSVTQKGSEHGDELTPQGFLGNNAGGVLGGISTGQEVVVQDGGQADLEHPPAAPHHQLAGEAGHQSKPTAATIPVSASAPRRSPRPCWRWC
jgi:chorismate synthase